MKFYEGGTCEEKPLKYYDAYTREACITEIAIDKAIAQCKCIPYVLDSKFATEVGGGLQPCNLNDTMLCVNQILGIQ